MDVVGCGTGGSGRSVRKLSALDRNAQGVKEVDVEWIAPWLQAAQSLRRRVALSVELFNRATNFDKDILTSWRSMNETMSIVEMRQNTFQKVLGYFQEILGRLVRLTRQGAARRVGNRNGRR